jgi:hypothetical protein
LFKRTLPAIVFGLVVASYAALAGCATSTGADHHEYWKTFNDADRIYNVTI